MSNLTIENFWKSRLSGLSRGQTLSVKGWSFPASGAVGFKEAPLQRSGQLNAEVEPATAPIVMVSAPGAVGKSTLARQIAFETGAVYVDLAEAEAVGANTIHGGIFRSGLTQHWQGQTTGILIDGLDEARLRVTQEAFEAFLGDIAEASQGRNVPTVLFGRTGAIQEAWLVLELAEVKAAVLEIGFYEPEGAVDFAEAKLRALGSKNSHHQTVEREAIAVLLERLREQTAVDGARFAGYAPVLQAVARRVSEEANPSGLVAAVKSGQMPVTLQTVVTEILDRERNKLSALPFEDVQLAQHLYQADEQLDRLAAILYGAPVPNMPAMSAKDTQTYSEALKNWVAEHPFLNGLVPSSAVFGAVVCTRALQNPKAAPIVIEKELRRGAANPFLAEFYMQKYDREPEIELTLPPEHVGVVYLSLRAGLSIGDTASLVVEEAEDAEEEDALKAEVEIVIARRDSTISRDLHFQTEQTGVLRLGSYVEDVEINVSHARVEIGPGREAVLVAPVSLQCEHLLLSTDKVIVEAPVGMREAAIYIEASTFTGDQVSAVPVIRGSVSLKCSWPDVQNHPWTSFASARKVIYDPRTDEALRRLRKFVIAFRSHSKGNLRRYQDKIEHARMTKGTGQAVLDHLKREDVVFLVGNMYELDPVKLGKSVGTSYADCMSWNFSETAVKFIASALKSK
ncbi:MAG: hypothetical protein WA840_04430 [Caulobacteraceae bacterium]